MTVVLFSVQPNNVLLTLQILTHDQMASFLMKDAINTLSVFVAHNLRLYVYRTLELFCGLF